MNHKIETHNELSIRYKIMIQQKQMLVILLNWKGYNWNNAFIVSEKHQKGHFFVQPQQQTLFPIVHVDILHQYRQTYTACHSYFCFFLNPFPLTMRCIISHYNLSVQLYIFVFALYHYFVWSESLWVSIFMVHLAVKKLFRRPASLAI